MLFFLCVCSKRLQTHLLVAVYQLFPCNTYVTPTNSVLRLTTWGAVGAQTSAGKLVSFPPAAVVSPLQLQSPY